MGPLLALEAQVNLVGKTDGLFALNDYIQNPELRRNTLIVSVQWGDRPWHSVYHRHTRTRTDRPMFSVSVLSRMEAAVGAAAGAAAVEGLRIVVVGCSGRYHRCTEVEALLVGKTVDRDTVSRAVKAAELGFPARMGFTSEYLEHCARTALERSLYKALGG
jgi:CO/xanthine dehydrogenase FAD-binding subunit